MCPPTYYLDGSVEDVNFSEALCHFLSLPWKIILTVFIPPSQHGFWAFLSSLICSGSLAYIMLHITTMLSCILGNNASIIVGVVISLPSVRAIWIRRSNHNEISQNISSSTVSASFIFGMRWFIIILHSSIVPLGQTSEGPNWS